ncbi:hypothetical protein [Streptomyces flaveolus]|uniref:hypothetical protein n=1 Tax=Streptomyces flaveolus TaxID=67297 RepID=UPI003F565A23
MKVDTTGLQAYDKVLAGTGIAEGTVSVQAHLTRGPASPLVFTGGPALGTLTGSRPSCWTATAATAGGGLGPDRRTYAAADTASRAAAASTAQPSTQQASSRRRRAR